MKELCKTKNCFVYGRFISVSSKMQHAETSLIPRLIRNSDGQVGLEATGEDISYKCTPVLFFPSCHIHLEFTARQYSLSRYCVLI